MQERHQNFDLYFEELTKTTEKYIIPFVDTIKKINPGMKIFEIGCGGGGNLLPFAKRGCEVYGLDISRSKIDSAKQNFEKEHINGHLFLANILDEEITKTITEKFDLIILNNVIEHIENKDLLLKRFQQFLAPSGLVFLCFPGWQMPFGGHQQVCKSKLISKFPFVHLLPNPLYRGLMKLCKEEKLEEMMEVKRCKITIEMFRRLVKQNEFKIAKSQHYLINPHYEIKFGLKPRKNIKPFSLIPHFRNYYTTTCYYIIEMDTN